MKKEITRLTQLLQEEVPSHMQVPKKNTSQRVGEFEKHTKEFGSKYMSKFGFGKVRDLIGMGKVLHKPFHLSRTTRLPPWVQMEV